MQKRMSFLIILVVVLSCHAAFALSVWINGAGSPYSSIQVAVNNAISGATLNISTGTFSEAVIINGKNLRLEGGYDEVTTNYIGGLTLINATGAVHGIWFNASTCQVYGVDVTGADNWGSIGGGVYLQNSDIRMELCGIYSNRSLNGGGIGVDGASRLVLTNYVFVNNNVSAWGGGVYMEGGLEVLNNVYISDNTASNGGGGICVYGGGDLYVNRGVISGNIATPANFAAGGGIYLEGSVLTVEELVDVAGNQAYWGGGIYLKSATAEVVTTSITYPAITTNIAMFGAGIFCNQCFHNDRHS